ncbi:C2H2-type zinc finger protein [Salarchaeum sp. JOR-1]|uniref:DUF7410 domain-containing protein n=1 Tax=Salarchaeum sp. JOR-1 TaxID=2599399 RepID=UPI001198B6A0|nr:C2H2-type zinc finger protein [Salarchaeum sp. JOR-1]QDX39657.1 C2H2-type zinc finger protein [Salarchaeum sp. JOR-1]
MTETHVPENADAATCPHCDAAFPTEKIRNLHVGRSHADAMSAAERDAYEDAYRADADDLRLFQYKALGALVLVYFFFLITYAVVA